jgi:hypothetical protein
MRNRCRAVLTFAMVAILLPVRLTHAQEAEVVSVLAKEIIEALGKDAVEFGGDKVARQTANRLMVEATESAGAGGGRIAKAQIERVLATGRDALVFDLKSISGKSLLLLQDVGDESLPAALGALTRPGVDSGIESLGSTALRKAALAGEIRLPGAGLKLVQYYGVEGAQLVTKLSEDQANSLIAALRPNAINALPSAERSGLLNAVASRPEARVFNFENITGPLVVIAGGIVIWHGIDVTLARDERVTELPDGTVVRENAGLGSRAVQTVPMTAHELSTPLKWTGVTLGVGATLIVGLLLWPRRKRSAVGIGKEKAEES